MKLYARLIQWSVAILGISSSLWLMHFGLRMDLKSTYLPLSILYYVGLLVLLLGSFAFLGWTCVLEYRQWERDNEVQVCKDTADLAASHELEVLEKANERRRLNLIEMSISGADKKRFDEALVDLTVENKEKVRKAAMDITKLATNRTLSLDEKVFQLNKIVADLQALKTPKP